MTHKYRIIVRASNGTVVGRYYIKNTATMYQYLDVLEKIYGKDSYDIAVDDLSEVD